MKSKTVLTMNIKGTGLYLLIVLAIACSITACKKDKTTDPTPEPVEVVAITLQDLKALAKDEAVTVPDGRKISGVVISNADGKNIAATSLVLQEATDKPGIIVNLAAAHSFKAGDNVEINISKQKLEKINGEITLTGIPVANVIQKSTGTVAARTTTVEELNANAAAWDGTLVQLGEGRFYGGNGKYATEGVEFEDANGKRVNIGVAGTATFKDQAYAASVNQLVGIVRLEGTKARLDIRNTGDVTGGEITQLLVEDFSDVEYSIADPGYNSEIIGYSASFTTAVEDWGDPNNGNNYLANLYYIQGNRFDGDLLSANRKYLYLIDGLNPVTGKPTATGNISLKFINLIKGNSGLKTKTISVTFAGSKLAGDGVLNYGVSGTGSITVNAFNPAADYFQLRIAIRIEDPNSGSLATLPFDSPKFTKTGEWNTFTVQVPTKAELLAKVASGEIANLTEEMVEAFYADPNPRIIFYNMSTRARFETETPSRAPIVFDKIEFGLTD